MVGCRHIQRLLRIVLVEELAAEVEVVLAEVFVAEVLLADLLAAERLSMEELATDLPAVRLQYTVSVVEQLSHQHQEALQREMSVLELQSKAVNLEVRRW
jgi:hypothetical protein